MHRVLDHDGIVALVRERGYAVVEAFLDEDVLARLTAECDALFRDGGPGVSPIRYTPSGLAVRLVRTELEEARFPTFTALYDSPQLVRLAPEALGECRSINEDIVVTHDVKDVPAPDLHFDLRRALKLFLYLVDCDEDNGALRYSPGTHEQNHRDRTDYLAAGGRFQALPNVAAPDESFPLETLAGRAGTLIVFDTEGWHTASRVIAGRERRTIRAACPLACQPVTHPRLFSRQWLRESRLNPARLSRRPPGVPGRGATGGWGRRRPKLTR